jgi:hypothetical protein
MPECDNKKPFKNDRQYNGQKKKNKDIDYYIDIDEIP